MRTTRTPFVCLLLLAACSRDPSSSKETATASAPADQPASVVPAAALASSAAAAPSASAAPAPTATPVATIGASAPAFTLTDLDGKTVSLADFLGKVVVLEWFNPGCPFVRASHTKGSLTDAARRAKAQGVVWLAINSGAPGQQGHGVPANRKGVETFALEHPVLLDEDGGVGRAYGAAKTPHLFVIDEKGTLVYGGAVDNSPDGEGESPEGGTLVRYVDQALAEVLAKKPVTVPSSKPYGCSVKYGK